MAVPALKCSHVEGVHCFVPGTDDLEKVEVATVGVEAFDEGVHGVAVRVLE